MWVLELFAGAGGAACGLRAAGFDGVQVERDLAATLTLEANGFDEVRCMDVKDYLATRKDERWDFIWASPPCQPFSRVGKQLGHADPRDGWPLVFQAVRQFRPRWLMCEQVPQGVTENVLTVLRGLFPAVTHVVVDAADYGVPQHRRRALLVCGPVEVSLPAGEYGPGKRYPWRTMRDALGVSLALGGGSNPRKAGDKRTERDLTNEPFTTICAHVGGNTLPRVRYPTTGSHGTSGTRPDLLDKPAPTVTTTEVKGTRAHAPKWKFNGGPDRASDAAFLATGIRRLEPEECAVLQGFPIGYTFKGNKTEVYRQIGNAVPPALALMVGEAVLAADGGL